MVQPVGTPMGPPVGRGIGLPPDATTPACALASGAGVVMLGDR
jgi:hypothetical protein